MFNQTLISLINKRENKKEAIMINHDIIKQENEKQRRVTPWVAMRLVLIVARKIYDGFDKIKRRR